jgi:hypothetical protein
VKFETPWGTVRTENVPRRNVYLERKPDNDAALAEMLTRQEHGDAVKRIIDVRINEPIRIVGVYVRKFRHATVEIPEGDYFINIVKDYEGDTYFVYEFVSPDEAKLVDDTSRIDYVLLALGHSQESRAGCAAIKILRGDIVWSDVKNTCCAIRSDAVAMIVARYGSRIAVAYNNLPYRGCCESWTVEEWIAEFPPRRVASYETTDPVASDLKPEEVV